MLNRQLKGIDSTYVRLYAATFAVALGCSATTVGVPYFVLARLARADAVGAVTAASIIAYLCACFGIQRFGPLVNQKVSTALAPALMAIFMTAFAKTHRLSPMLIFTTGQGLSMALFWPPLMAWISGSAEGGALSRRLAIFNISWSVSFLLGPQLAGILAEQDVVLPLYFAAACWLVGTAIILITPFHRSDAIDRSTAVSDPSPQTEPAAGNPAENAPANVHPNMRYLAWMAVFVGYMAFGVFRFQMPHLAETLAIRKAIFGTIMMLMSATTSLSFLVTGKWTGWHGRLRWIFLPQLAIAAVALLTAAAGTAYTLATLASIVGFAVGMLYMASIFYGSTGAEPAIRTRRMAIHEACLSAGIAVGTFAGNWLSQNLNPHIVYAYLAVATTVAAAAQVVVWQYLKQRCPPDARPSQVDSTPAADNNTGRTR